MAELQHRLSTTINTRQMVHKIAQDHEFTAHKLICKVGLTAKPYR